MVRKAKTKTQVFDLFYDILDTNKESPAFAFSVDLRLFEIVGIDPQRFIENYLSMALNEGFERRVFCNDTSFIIGFYKPGTPEEQVLDCIEHLANLEKEVDLIESCARA